MQVNFAEVDMSSWKESNFCKKENTRQRNEILESALNFIELIYLIRLPKPDISS